MASRSFCINHPDSFGYICGKFTPKSQQLKTTKKVTVAYKYYFGCKVGDQDKLCAPHICCRNCYACLTQWLNGKRKSMPFAVTTVWRKPTNHFSDCYFCLTQITGHSKKSKAKIVYPNCDSALRPLNQPSQEIPIPISPSFLDINAEINDGPNASPQYAALLSSDSAKNVDEHFTLSKAPHILNQSDLNKSEI